MLLSTDTESVNISERRSSCALHSGSLVGTTTLVELLQQQQQQQTMILKGE